MRLSEWQLRVQPVTRRLSIWRPFGFSVWTFYQAPAKPQHVDCHISIGLPVTRRFPSQRASNAGNVSIWWRHHEFMWTQLALEQEPKMYGSIIYSNTTTMPYRTRHNLTRHLLTQMFITWNISTSNMEHDTVIYFSEHAPRNQIPWY